MAIERLQKILSNAGASSRRKAEELIIGGHVAVNGVVQDQLGARADPDVDEVTVDGVPVRLERYRYFALNKPAGFVTTASDDQGRPTVLDLVAIGDIQLHPVGRLDMDSEGLLLVTNDGHLTDLLTHPRYQVEKEYLVALDAPLSRADLQRLVRGLESDGDRLRALSAHPATPPATGPGEELPDAGAWLLLTLAEGKNREIRRMMTALGRQVRLLRRIRVGPLHIGGMSTGSFRELTAEEVHALYATVTVARERAAREPERPPGSKKFKPTPPRGAPARATAPRPGSRAATAKAPQDEPAPRRAKPAAGAPAPRATGTSGAAAPRGGAPRSRVAPPRDFTTPAKPGGPGRPGAKGPRRAADPAAGEGRGPARPSRGPGGPARGPGGPARGDSRASGPAPASGGPRRGGSRLPSGPTAGPARGRPSGPGSNRGPAGSQSRGSRPGGPAKGPGGPPRGAGPGKGTARQSPRRPR
ncbi:MAG: pseudouridine synthase [Dehalococcoidia bacterium]|nr:pseudouridine synthase [Dehalococcoidia bacterium]